MISFIQRFIKQEFFSGCLLLLAAVLALVSLNSPLAPYYEHIRNLNLEFGTYHISFQLCLNEGLMTFFFLLVGIEIKRELCIGELNEFKKAILPLIAALGGMLMPCLLYVLVNSNHPSHLVGWAIPSATDIAFALAVLGLFSKRIPLSLKIFLMALAIIDDLGAILIIGFFYTQTLVPAYLLVALGIILILFLLNRWHIGHIAPYLVLGLCLWLALFKSGIHPTLAGVILAFLYPLRNQKGNQNPHLLRFEWGLIPWVNYLILPLFAFLNAGLSLQSMDWHTLSNTLSLGIIVGLFIGKQLGVFLTVFFALRFKWATLPQDVTLSHLYGVSILCGIGFTMSLFIGGLAFVGQEAILDTVRLGVLLGSLLSAIFGISFMMISTRNQKIIKA